MVFRRALAILRGTALGKLFPLSGAPHLCQDAGPPQGQKIPPPKSVSLSLSLLSTHTRTRTVYFQRMSNVVFFYY